MLSSQHSEDWLIFLLIGVNIAGVTNPGHAVTQGPDETLMSGFINTGKNTECLGNQ